jgi:signal transduction histidine kinase
MTSHLQTSAPAQWRRSWGIQARLILAFGLGLVFIVTVVELLQFFGVPYTSYSGRLGDYRAEASRTLDLIADMKEERLRWWIDERRRDLSVFVGSRTGEVEVEELVDLRKRYAAEGLQGKALAAKIGAAPAYARLFERLKDINKTYREYQRTLIVDARDQRVLISTDPGDVGQDMSGRAFVAGPLAGKGSYVGDVQWMPAAQGPVLHVSDMLHAASDPQKVIGVMVVEIRTEDTLRPLLHTGEALGARGEAQLIDQDRMILASLKFPLPDGTRPKPLQYRLETEAARRAVSSPPGAEGVIESVDYRGISVLAAYRSVKISDDVSWGLIVKRDRDELLAPLWAEARDSLWIGLAGIAALAAMTVLVARTVTAPIRALARTAQQVSQGDLDARAPVTTSDEVGRLAVTFNEMIQRIQDAQAVLVRQERLAALGQLTATVSHEIRNPLGTIRTSFFIISQRLRGKGLDIEPTLDRIERSIARCDAIIADLLDFSRNRAAQREPTDGDQWLAAVLDEYEAPRGVTLTRDLAAATSVPLDRERFRRCVINLLTNACQAMEDEGGCLNVVSRAEDHRWVVRICDTGCGIQPEQLSKIFEPLYSTKNFGAGLGLAIVKQIVDQHQGAIEVESQAGRGTAVTVRLPTEDQEKRNE